MRIMCWPRTSLAAVFCRHRPRGQTGVNRNKKRRPLFSVFLRPRPSPERQLTAARKTAFFRGLAPGPRFLPKQNPRRIKFFAPLARSGRGGVQKDTSWVSVSRCSNFASAKSEISVSNPTTSPDSHSSDSTVPPPSRSSAARDILPFPVTPRWSTCAAPRSSQTRRKRPGAGASEEGFRAVLHR